MFRGVYHRFRNRYTLLRRKKHIENMRKRLLNHDFSLVSSNCNGACILHDLQVPFNSPFVNLWMKPDEYIKMLQNFRTYMSYELTFIQENGIDYPIGLLGDVRIYFQHYGSEEEAKQKWEERSARLNYENLFILFTDRDGCTEQNLIDFDRIPYKNKVVFVHVPNNLIASAAYIRGFEKEEAVGLCMNYKHDYAYKKYYDDFDYVKWFNHG